MIENDPLRHHQVSQSKRLVIGASSLGTALEFYDFYLYGLLATYISAHFFSGVNETTASSSRWQHSRWDSQLGLWRLDVWTHR